MRIRSHSTRFLLALTFASLTLAACSKSTTDPNFDASVSNPAYQEDGPIVLFDEGHGNLHEAGGSYRPLATLLEADGYRIDTSTNPLDRVQLAKADILIIANARGTSVLQDDSAFSNTEIDAIAEWVAEGGGLLLIADHFPFGGAAQSLSAAFGVDMGEGLVEDPKHHAANFDSSHLEFSEANGLLGRHPIIEGRNPDEVLRRVITFTGQSLSVPPGGVGLLTLSADAVDLEAFPTVEGSGDDTNVSVDFINPVSADGRVQGLALDFESGRVVVLGEAAVFTAQVLDNDDHVGMNLEETNNKQFALNIFHWLSGLLR